MCRRSCQDFTDAVTRADGRWSVAGPFSVENSLAGPVDKDRVPLRSLRGSLDWGNDTLALDIEATKAHRANMQRQGLPHDEPITEIIIPFPSAPQPQARSPEHEKMTESGLRLPCSAGVAGDQVARRQRILILFVLGAASCWHRKLQRHLVLMCM